MTVEQLRRVWTQVPFEPFLVHLADGRVLRVPHRDFMIVPPTAQRTFGVADEDGIIETVDLLLVVSLKPMNGKANGRRRRAG